MRLNKNQKQKIKALAGRYKISTLYLFGSQARGDAGRSSDHDFAVIFSDQVKLKDYSSLQILIISELLSLFSLERIDLVILNSADVPLFLKFNIIRDGEVIIDSDKNGRVFVEANIMSRWYDWQYFEKMRSEIYLQQTALGKI